MLPTSLRTARVAVAALFFVNGALFAGWVTRVPDVRDRVGAGEAELGLALLGVAVGAMLTMPIAGWACARFGGHVVAVAGGLAGCASIALPALADDLGQLAVALGLIGATFGLLDVAMNVEAIAVERAYRRPLMPSFHGWFSTGGLAGALAGGAVAGAGAAAAPHLAATSAVGAAAVAWAGRHLMPRRGECGGPDGEAAAPRGGASRDSGAAARGERGERGASRDSGAAARERGASRGGGATPILVVCGLIAFCAAVGEGAMADWSALYLTDSLDAGGGVAALGYAAFAGAMAAGRFAGERAIRALGPAGVLQLGCGAAALAMAVGLATHDRAGTIAAFAVAGLGVACVFPVVLSTADRAEPGRSGPAVAFVSTVGYTGFLAGPPLIGFVADRSSLGWGLGVVALLAAAAAVLAAGLRPGRAGVRAPAPRPARAPRTRTHPRTPCARGEPPAPASRRRGGGGSGRPPGARPEPEP
jgi:MFS family permease